MDAISKTDASALIVLLYVYVVLSQLAFSTASCTVSPLSTVFFPLLRGNLVFPK